MQIEYKPLPTDGLEYRGGKEIGHVAPDFDGARQDNNTNNQNQESSNN